MNLDPGHYKFMLFPWLFTRQQRTICDGIDGNLPLILCMDMWQMMFVRIVKNILIRMPYNTEIVGMFDLYLNAERPS